MTKFRSTLLDGAGVGPATPSRIGKSLNNVFNSDAKRFADHRGAVRHRLARETATIGFKGETLEVDLINLSGGGAMIEADISPSLWDRVDLYLGDGSPIECAVRWLRGSRIGLEFAHETRIECAPDEHDALLLDVIRRNFPDTIAAGSPSDSTPAFDASRRGDTRHPLIWNGVIEWQAESCTVRLRNISASGVLIDSPVDYPEGVEVMLDLRKSGRYIAIVGWSRSGQAGLVFKVPFQLSALAAARPDVAAPRWKRPAYLDRCADQASPWADEWHRRDLSDLGNDLAG